MISFSGIIICISIGSILATLITRSIFHRTLKGAPRIFLNKKSSSSTNDTSLSVIIPTYNEAGNIEDCIKSIINSEEPAKRWSIIVSDDSSSDKTLEIAQKTLSNFSSKKEFFKVINAGVRPSDKNWVGKNWPCHIAAKSTNSNWLLFVDADLRVSKYAINSALEEAINRDSDLLSLAPEINCSCISEWLVQPIMAILLPIGFPIKATNNPNNSMAFAAGPFMLFRESTYRSIGGHESVATEVVEDIALSKIIKKNGYNLNFLLAVNAINLRMYKNFSALLEGWTKNWYIGLQKDGLKLISGSILILMIFTFPWLIFILCVSLIASGQTIGSSLIISTGLSILSIYNIYLLRSEIKSEFRLSTKYWWLSGVGGLIIAIIGPISMLKTITGIGWTWKGRKLTRKI